MAAEWVKPLPTYLLLENDKKSNNLGPVLRCAAAYGIATVIAIGFSQCSVEGSHGASKHISIVAFPTAEQAIASIHQDRSLVSTLGILGGAPLRNGMGHMSTFPVQEDAEAGIFRLGPLDITAKLSDTKKQSWPVRLRRFEESKIHCFVICKSRHGLSSLLARHCDSFVHIPHRNMGGDFAGHSLLDLPACLTIVLHHHSEWAGNDERTFVGHKFELKNVQMSEMEKREERRNQRKEEKKRQREEMKSEDYALTTQLFGDGGDGGDY